MATAAPAVRLRPVATADQSLILRWLAQPDIEAWWGPRSATQAEVTIALGETTALCRIIEADGEPVGYAHAVDAMVWGASLPDDLEPGTYDIDLFIASAAHRGRGVGQAALRALMEEVFTTTLTVAVCVFASVANEGAVRAYEKAGFRWRRVVADPVMGHEWFMIAQRPRR